MTLDELAAEYLHLPNGQTAEDPCAWMCGDGDVDNWVGVVRRIRVDILVLAKLNRGRFTIPTMGNAARWSLDAGKFRGGTVWNTFGAGTDEVAELVVFARAGVKLLWTMQQEAEADGGTVPAPGPMPLDVPKPADVSNLALYGVIGLVAYLLIMNMRSR